MQLTVVTAMLDPARTRDFWHTWRANARDDFRAVVALTGQEDTGWYPDTVGIVAELHGLVTREDSVTSNAHLGVVPYFHAGVVRAAEKAEPHDLIACLHDDLAIFQAGWDVRVKDFFVSHPDCVLLGFGGATGLGADEIYQVPYQPMQLARQNFCSNMKQAELHGKRVTYPVRVACLDGFSLIGRRNFMVGAWDRIRERGVIHHAYDGMLGVLAAQEGGEVWMLPIPCHHHGGMTAVGDPRYREKIDDAAVWEQAHKAFYELGRGTLPIRV